MACDIRALLLQWQRDLVNHTLVYTFAFQCEGRFIPVKIMCYSVADAEQGFNYIVGEAAIIAHNMRCHAPQHAEG
jgi:hypothetical protein